MEKEKLNLPYYSALLGSVFLLVSIGLLALYAASAMKSAELFENPFHYLEKQGLALVLGLIIIMFFKWVPFKYIERLTLPLLGTSLLMLGAILIPGAYKTVGGASRWVNLGITYFQPSELAKLGLIFFLAKNLSRRNYKAENIFSSVLPNVLFLALFCVFLMLQPDFGTAVLLVCITFMMITVSGVRLRFLASSIFLSFCLGVAAILSAPYRWKRLTSFINPWADFKNGGFQIIQSYLGFQNGGLFGAGLGESRQKLFFLPEAHTDFIFTVIGEEMGLFGSIIVCFLYLNIVRIGFSVSLRHIEPFKKLLAFGLTSLIALQASFNLGVVMGLFPTKGIPLPFISSGLSSLIIFFTAIAVLARLAQEMPHNEKADKTEATLYRHRWKRYVPIGFIRKSVCVPSFWKRQQKKLEN